MTLLLPEEAMPSNAKTKLDPRAKALHQAACQRREAGYIDPQSGLFVLTSHYLREQLECCGSGCRHCPYSENDRLAAGRDPDAPAWPYP